MKRELLGILGVFIIFISIMAGGWYLWKGFVLPEFGRMAGDLYILFAFLAGIASFFAPCAFALLPGYASYYLGLDIGKGKTPAYIGFVTATGILAFYLFLGILVYVLGSAISPYLRYFKPAVGFILVLLGIMLYTRSFYIAPLSSAVSKVYSEHSAGGALAFFLFGVAYAATALGCTLPIFLVLVIYPLFTGELLLGFLAFVSYSLAKAVLMIAVTYLVAYSKDTLIKRLAMSTGKIKKFSGLAIVLIGIYLIYSGGI
jgi:cytochrome c-type biogenesis protein